MVFDIVYNVSVVGRHDAMYNNFKIDNNQELKTIPRIEYLKC